MKYHLITLGCQMNKSDSERVASVIEKMGFEHTEEEDKANLVGILACSVRQKAIDKVYGKIHKWNKLKNKRNLITFVSGCILPEDREKFLKLFDMVFTMNELTKFPEMLSQYGVVTPFKINQEEEIDFATDEPKAIKMSSKPDLKLVFNPPEKNINSFWDVRPSYQSNFEAFVPIQNGCDKFCTFCAVPYTRGREVSRPSEEIIQEVKTLVERGYKTITLLGQNVNSYGLDKPGELSFSGLLEAIGDYGDKTAKAFWLYFTSPHPRDMKDDVIHTIAKYKCLAKQIHLPLQSGNDKVLIKMNRKHSLAQYRKIVDSIRKHLPQATLFTDIIVGFTGESDEHFQSTVDAMNAFKFNMAYIAKYSPRPGAASSRWDDDVNLDTKKERLQKLSMVLKKHAAEYNRKLQGKTLKVLVVKKDRKNGYLSALSEGRIIVRFASDNTALIGKFVRVKVRATSDFSVEGELLEEKAAIPQNA